MAPINNKSQQKGKPHPAKGGRQNQQDKPKRKVPAWENKFKDEIVDYFDGAQDADGEQMFNKMPILKENNRVMKPSKKAKNLKQKSDIINSDDEFERMMMGGQSKKLKSADDDIFGGESGLFTAGEQSFSNFFIQNKYALLQLEKVPVLRYSPGTQVLTAVSEYGSNGQYMVVNLSRNKKAFVTVADATEASKEENDLRIYDQGEYLIGEIVPSIKEGNMNVSIKTSKVNSGLQISDIHLNMILPGLVSSKEDHGAKIEFNGGEKYFGFLSKDEANNFEDLEEGRVYMFRVIKKEEKKRLVHLSQKVSDQEGKFVVSGEVDIEDGADLHHLAKPGNLVNAVILKVLNNGLIVRFLKQFIGFIFEDHLDKEISAYKEKEKLLARIIASDFDQKQINLSVKKAHIDLKPYEDNSIVTGDVLTDGFVVTKALYGGSYFVKPNNSNIQQSFLHKAHIEKEELKEGQTYTDAIKIKEINYFEQIPIITAKGELVKRVTNWNDLRPGMQLSAKIDKIIQGANNQYKLKVAVNDKMIGLVDFYNTADIPKAGPVPKNLKEGRKIKVRIMSVNPSDKTLRFTIKPALLNEEDDKILKNISNAQVGDSYLGFISRKTEYGYIVQFFGDVIGLLTFKDIEEINGHSRDEYKVGQVIRVYIAFVNAEQGKIGLSISEKGVSQLQKQKLSQNTSRKTLFEFQAINENVENISHNVGDVLEYIVENNQALQDVLTLYHKEHRAIIAIEHLSDFRNHYQSLNQYYRTLPNKGNQVTIKCKIIHIMPNKNVIVSAKPSILSNMNPNSLESVKANNIYTAYIDRGARKGVLVKFNERVKFFIGKENLDEHAAFQTYDSVLVFVKNVEGDKITASLQNEAVFKKQAHINSQFNRFIEYFNDEYMLNKKFTQGEHKKTWNKYRVGNYVNTTIELVKEFGIVVKVNDSPLTGLIMNEHVANTRSTLAEGQTLLCRITDIDFEKQMVDVIPSPIDDNTKLTTLLQSNNFNLDKFLELENNETIDATVICQKGEYIICQITKAPKVFCYVNMTNFNNLEHEEMLFGQKIKNLKCVNKEILQKTHKNAQSTNMALRSNYIPLFEQQVNQQNKGTAIEEKSGITLKPGIKVVGKVLKTVGFNVFVQLKGKLYGKLHKSQCQDAEQFASFKEGQQIDCKILYLKKDKSLQIDLTTKQAHMNSTLLEESEVLSMSIDNFRENCVGQIHRGVVKSTDPSSIHPVYIELSNYHHGYFSAFDLDAEDLNQIKKKYKKGSIVECRIVSLSSSKENDLKHIQLSPKLLSADESAEKKDSIKVGDLVTAKIVKKNNNGFRVQISDNLFGNVDITEICDEWIANASSSIQINSFVKARVIAEEGDHKYLSLRSSVTNEQNWKNSLGPNGTTINYKKYFSDSEKIGDLRNRIIKLGPGSIKVGMVFVGYINQTNDKGCFIKIGQDTVVRASLNELSDEHIAKPQTHFYQNKLVVGRIIQIKEDGKIEASLRESVIKYGYSMDDSKLQVGATVYGTVVGHYQGRASVSIRGCKFRASLDKDDTDFTDEEKMGYVEKLLPIGSAVKAKVIKYEKEPKVKIILSTEKLVFDKYSNVEEAEKEESEQSHLDLLIKSVDEINVTAKVADEKTTEIKITKNYALNQENKTEQDEEKMEEEDEEQEDDEDNKSDLDEDEIQNLIANQGVEFEGFEGNEEAGDDDEGEDDESILSEQSLLDEEFGEEDIISNKKKSRRQKEIIKRKKEEEIREQEKKLIDENAQPENRDDYEKLILKNPNSSYVWIQFIAFVIEKEGIQAAREVTERALRVINFKNENEKLNIWTAYLNLEHNFGEEKALVKVFERAKASCKPKDVYFKLLEIYRRDSSKYELLFQLSKNMVTKFKHSSKCWIEHVKNVILYRDSMIEKKQENKLNQSHDPKEVLKRALICLKKKKHIIVLSQYAKIQYQSKQAETGRTTFEAVVANYPKRTDIWNVYIDMEMKYGTLESARNLFERVITMQFKPRQMKFFFKKYLQFEATKGTTERVEEVKQKAAEYVQSLIGQDEDNEQEEEQNEMDVEEQNGDEEIENIDDDIEDEDDE
ncbi:S1 RNA-binding domain protein (macronuclear) [Tetrahymena thermophila SB210]|uniref:S1 RNA-binding domain protein n=1 Tax=Tetrahymena thermophila (strain SB210) TaxID=312017 RepID=Q23TZ6_TETTS|nr:S1 RNA-binding domain protein [Tetrahymena thermophila SB210]EAR99985.1 S1 RNA-binding domain protein [Tetrahymena thermophila SB210]|eukprot:XP_001020230.1 S1 RNA-binding domain protein [Tetrahymena thermophila SB210]